MRCNTCAALRAPHSVEQRKELNYIRYLHGVHVSNSSSGVLDPPSTYSAANGLVELRLLVDSILSSKSPATLHRTAVSTLVYTHNERWHVFSVSLKTINFDVEISQQPNENTDTTGAVHHGTNAHCQKFWFSFLVEGYVHGPRNVGAERLSDREANKRAPESTTAVVIGKQTEHGVD